MATDKQKGKLSDWLDTIQQDSWQLELVISGFVVFLLIGGWEPVKELEYDLGLMRDTSANYWTFNFLYHVFRMAYATLLGCLLIHVIMRGLWIAAVGLRSVSGEIDYDELTCQPRFTDRSPPPPNGFFRCLHRAARTQLQRGFFLGLPTGRHELLLRARILENDSLRWSDGRTIYFYK